MDGGPAHAVGQRGRELGSFCLKIYQVGNRSWSRSFLLNDGQGEDKASKGFKNWDKRGYIWNDKEGAREGLQREVSQSKQQGRKMIHAAMRLMEAKGKAAFIKTRKSVCRNQDMSQ